MHQFPKRDANLCNEWIKACNRPGINIKTAKICSLHFTEESYLLRDRLMNTSFMKKRLSSTAVPTLLLPLSKDERSIRAARKSWKKMENELLKESESKKPEENIKFENEINEEISNNIKQESMMVVDNSEHFNKNEKNTIQPFIKVEKDDTIQSSTIQVEELNIKIEPPEEISIESPLLKYEESKPIKDDSIQKEIISVAIPRQYIESNVSPEEQICELQKQLNEIHRKYVDQQNLLKDVVQTAKFLISKIKLKYAECDLELKETRRKYIDKEIEYLKLKRELEILTTTLADNYLIKA